MVLSPGGWAQGMRFSGTFNIQVKNGSTRRSSSPMRAHHRVCWRQSGNSDNPDNFIEGIAPNMELEVQGVTFRLHPDGRS